MKKFLSILILLTICIHGCLLVDNKTRRKKADATKKKINVKAKASLHKYEKEQKAKLIKDKKEIKSKIAKENKKIKKKVVKVKKEMKALKNGYKKEKKSINVAVNKSATRKIKKTHAKFNKYDRKLKKYFTEISKGLGKLATINQQILKEDNERDNILEKVKDLISKISEIISELTKFREKFKTEEHVAMKASGKRLAPQKDLELLKKAKTEIKGTLKRQLRMQKRLDYIEKNSRVSAGEKKYMKAIKL